VDAASDAGAALPEAPPRCSPAAMSPLRSPEREIDAALAAELIAEQFPALGDPSSPARRIDPARLSRLGEGWDNSAFLLDWVWVFRFPRRAVAAPLLEREAQFLPRLARVLPIPIPSPIWVGRATERYPWPFAGYRMVEGETACSSVLSGEARGALASPLAEFLAALHGWTPPTDVAALPGDEIGRLDFAKRAPLTEARLRELITAGAIDPSLATRLIAATARWPRLSGKPRRAVPVHGDLYVRHLLISRTGAFAGVIDWGDLHRNDPAVDLSIAFSFLPPEARSTFHASYEARSGQIADRTWERARARAIAHAAQTLLYAIEVADAALIREMTQALGWALD